MVKEHDIFSSTYVLHGNENDPKIALFSGIHGDELSGVKALQKFIKNVQNGSIEIIKGNITCVVGANEAALKLGKRQCTYNMNRILLDENSCTDDYENARAQELKSILKDSDYLLDLHSTSGPSIPFIFSEIQNFDLASRLGISHVITGWSELGEEIISGDTESYINEKGGVGFTFEAGNHDNPEGEQVAYQMILNFLAVLGCINMKYFSQIGEKNTFIHMKQIYIAQGNNFSYNFETENFMRISEGSHIANDQGEKVIAPYDMILVMPKAEKMVKKGDEVFFIAQEI